MSHQVLARKWRPKNFETLVGQTGTITALRNALTSQRLHHAYLFTGTRGVGKTTIARIFAKALNCEQGINDKPCETCSCCTAINNGNFVDLIEVDAASRTKVEDTRELLDNVQYTPTQGRFKIYLIDEVHMLSTHSFNALLKTLEEPPEHIKFLLATTDPQKLPITVLSRCLQFHLKNLTPNQIENHLNHVLNTEKIVFESDAIKRIAQLAQGSARDALSLLEQAIAYCPNEITSHDINELFGLIDKEYLLSIFEALEKNSAEIMLSTLQKLTENNQNPEQLLNDLIISCHAIALHQASSNTCLDESNLTSDELQRLSKIFSKEDIQLFYQICLMGQRDLSLAPTQRIGCEMTLLRLLAFRPAQIKPKKTTVIPSAVEGTPNASAGLTLAKFTKESGGPSTPLRSAQDDNTLRPAQPNYVKTSSGEDNNTINWNDIVSRLSLSGIDRLLADNCSMKCQNNNHWELNLAPEHTALLNQRTQTALQQAISDLMNTPIKLTVHLAASNQKTPAELSAQKKDERYQAAEKSLTEDSTVKALLHEFDGTLDESSIQIND